MSLKDLTLEYHLDQCPHSFHSYIQRLRWANQPGCFAGTEKFPRTWDFQFDERAGHFRQSSLIPSSPLPGKPCAHHILSQLEYVLIYQSSYGKSHLLLFVPPFATPPHRNSSSKNLPLNTWVSNFKPSFSFPGLQEVIQTLSAFPWPSTNHLPPGISVPGPSWSFQAHISQLTHWPLIWLDPPFLAHSSLCHAPRPQQSSPSLLKGWFVCLSHKVLEGKCPTLSDLL